MQNFRTEPMPMTQSSSEDVSGETHVYSLRFENHSSKGNNFLKRWWSGDPLSTHPTSDGACEVTVLRIKPCTRLWCEDTWLASQGRVRNLVTGLQQQSKASAFLHPGQVALRVGNGDCTREWGAFYSRLLPDPKTGAPLFIFKLF